MHWRKVDSPMDCCWYYVNTKTGKQVRLSYFANDLRRIRRYRKLNKIREHKRLLFQIKFYLYKDMVATEGKQSFNVYNDPIGSDRLFNRIDSIDLKQYKFGLIKNILKHLFSTERTFYRFIDEFFSIILLDQSETKEHLFNWDWDFVCFVANNIKFIDRFNVLGTIRLSNIYRDNQSLKRNIEEYDKTGETLWRKECLAEINEKEIRNKQEIEKMERKYKENLKRHRYFAW